MPSAVLLAANGSELSRHIGFVAKHSDKYEKEIVRLMESQQ
tara:strand:- start:501 stop:623 length:123 start_codon:yes stop_codon:yes gene_type:complete